MQRTNGMKFQSSVRYTNTRILHDRRQTIMQSRITVRGQTLSDSQRAKLSKYGSFRCVRLPLRPRSTSLPPSGTICLQPRDSVQRKELVLLSITSVLFSCPYSLFIFPFFPQTSSSSVYSTQLHQFHCLRSLYLFLK